MNYYEILGVSSDASEDQIKKAYRKRAREAHPDKGGSDDEMAKVNRAYEVLVSAERRKLYDAMGDDVQLSSVEEMARSVVLNAFAEVLQKNIEHGCMDHVRKFISGKSQTAAEKNRMASSERDKLLRRRDKIKSAEGKPNLFHMVCDQMLQTCERAIAESQNDMNIAALAMEIVRDYTSIEAAQQGMSTIGRNVFFQFNTA